MLLLSMLGPYLRKLLKQITYKPQLSKDSGGGAELKLSGRPVWQKRGGSAPRPPPNGGFYSGDAPQTTSYGVAPRPPQMVVFHRVYAPKPASYRVAQASQNTPAHQSSTNCAGVHRFWQGAAPSPPAPNWDRRQMTIAAP